MTRQIGRSSNRRRAGRVLLTQLLVLSLLPLAEALHEHGPLPGHGRQEVAELHSEEGCDHEGQHAHCCLLVRTASALPPPGIAVSVTPTSISAVARRAEASDLPGPSASPALPRAPPLG